MPTEAQVPLTFCITTDRFRESLSATGIQLVKNNASAIYNQSVLYKASHFTLCPSFRLHYLAASHMHIYWDWEL